MELKRRNRGGENKREVETVVKIKIVPMRYDGSKENNETGEKEKNNKMRCRLTFCIGREVGKCVRNVRMKSVMTNEKGQTGFG